MSGLRKFLVPAVLIALVLAAGVWMFTGGDDRKTLVASFPRTISLYQGSDVRVLGVAIGQVDKITPDGTDVVVEMSYDREIDLPQDAEAVIIAPSIVGDRYVQITPVYTGGAKLADGAILDQSRTSVPLELDQVYSSLNDLTVAIGPDGANKNGALTDLLEVTAENFLGQGAQFHQTIADFSELSATLDDNKEELFGSAAELEKFIGTLAQNDQTVRDFNQSLSAVSTMLSGEKEELTASLRNLSVALGEVTTFVKDNKALLSRNIKGINRVAKVLVKQRAALEETLINAPLALNNLALTYNPQAGTLDTNANLGNIEHEIASNPALLLCSFVEPNDPTGSACDAIQQILPRAGVFTQGTGSSSNERFDQSLGGLVEVGR
ncbi:MCE family protein [Nocardioides sp.]|uniref:MCE family protein n=1 Tax=Nocardioides sp. TaxID=35761 RepID=UPI00356262EA